MISNVALNTVCAWYLVFVFSLSPTTSPFNLNQHSLIAVMFTSEILNGCQ